jgi:hypothetical protein
VAIRNDGGTVTCGCGTPQNTSACFGLMALRLNVATAGSLTMKQMTSVGLNYADTPHLLSAILGQGWNTYNTPQTGGWWSAGGSPTPVGCQYLYVRLPFVFNRLRIHNRMVLQTL